MIRMEKSTDKKGLIYDKRKDSLSLLGFFAFHASRGASFGIYFWTARFNTTKFETFGKMHIRILLLVVTLSPNIRVVAEVLPSYIFC